jgi:hypothetical protein
MFLPEAFKYWAMALIPAPAMPMKKIFALLECISVLNSLDMQAS